MRHDSSMALAWQLPLLLLLAGAILPDLPWRHPDIGFWPLWLLAAPAMAYGLAWRRKRHTVPAMPPVRTGQVIVFPPGQACRPASGTRARRAA